MCSRRAISGLDRPSPTRSEHLLLAPGQRGHRAGRRGAGPPSERSSAAAASACVVAPIRSNAVQRGRGLDDRQLRGPRRVRAGQREPHLGGVEGQLEPGEDRQRGAELAGRLVEVAAGGREVPGRGRGLARPPSPPAARPRVRRAARRCARPRRAGRRRELGLDEQRQHGGGAGGAGRRRPGSAPAARPRPRSRRGPDAPWPRTRSSRAVGQQRLGLLDPALAQPQVGQPGDRLRVRHRAGPPGHPDGGGELALGLRPTARSRPAGRRSGSGRWRT